MFVYILDKSGGVYYYVDGPSYNIPNEKYVWLAKKVDLSRFFLDYDPIHEEEHTPPQSYLTKGIWLFLSKTLNSSSLKLHNSQFKQDFQSLVFAINSKTLSH